jgi:hypothetical protein
MRRSKIKTNYILRALLTFREVENPNARDAALHYVIPRMPDHNFKENMVSNESSR